MPQSREWWGIWSLTNSVKYDAAIKNVILPQNLKERGEMPRGKYSVGTFLVNFNNINMKIELWICKWTSPRGTWTVQRTEASARWCWKPTVMMPLKVRQKLVFYSFISASSVPLAFLKPFFFFLRTSDSYIVHSFLGELFICTSFKWMYKMTFIPLKL